MTSSLLAPTTPHFYGVYLLRSYKSSSPTPFPFPPKPTQATYIGSTPRPWIRKRQHNGELTQGAHRTRNGRPWEMELIVFGFPSKIAALQFEWAWQKASLSRHLREKIPLTHVGSGERSGATRPIFPTTKGRGRGTYRPPSRQILVLRCLLRSEPFCHWGLRLVFFAEWAWAAWEKAQRAATLTDPPLARRSGRALPTEGSSPAVRCDFRGVDGKRRPLLEYTDQERQSIGLKQSESTSLAKTGARKQAQSGQASASISLAKESAVKDVGHHWHETLPVSASVKGMGLTWDRLEKDHPVSPVLNLPAAADESATPPVWPPRMTYDDADLTYLSLHRFLRVLSSHNAAPSNLLGPPDTPSSSSSTTHAYASLCIPCSLCAQPIDLNTADPTSYTVCPAPFLPLRPTRIDQAHPLEAQEAVQVDEISSCDGLFHLRCLAQQWLDEERKQSGTPVGDTQHLLPLKGTCPSPTCRGEVSTTGDSLCDAPSRRSGKGQEGLWSDVVRSVYRRREWLRSSRLLAEDARVFQEEMITSRDGVGVKEAHRDEERAWDPQRILLRGRVGAGRRKRRRVVKASEEGRSADQGREGLSGEEEDEDVRDDEDQGDSDAQEHHVDPPGAVGRLVGSARPRRKETAGGPRLGGKSRVPSTASRAARSVSSRKKAAAAAPTSPLSPTAKRVQRRADDTPVKGEDGSLLSPVRKKRAARGETEEPSSLLTSSDLVEASDLLREAMAGHQRGPTLLGEPHTLGKAEASGGGDARSSSSSSTADGGGGEAASRQAATVATTAAATATAAVDMPPRPRPRARAKAKAHSLTASKRTTTPGIAAGANEAALSARPRRGAGQGGAGVAVDGRGGRRQAPVVVIQVSD